jgi:hypothetical protein
MKRSIRKIIKTIRNLNQIILIENQSKTKTTINFIALSKSNTKISKSITNVSIAIKQIAIEKFVKTKNQIYIRKK